MAGPFVHIEGRGQLLVYAALFVGFVLVLPPVGYSRRHAAWWVFPYTAWIMALAVMWRIASPRPYWLDAKPSRWAKWRARRASMPDRPPAILVGGSEWRVAWRGARYATKERVLRAVNRPGALSDPFEAALAVGIAKRRLRR